MMCCLVRSIIIEHTIQNLLCFNVFWICCVTLKWAVVVCCWNRCLSPFDLLCTDESYSLLCCEVVQLFSYVCKVMPVYHLFSGQDVMCDCLLIVFISNIIVSLKVLVLIQLESVDAEIDDRRLVLCFTSMAVDVIRMLFASLLCHRFDLLTACRHLLLGWCKPL